MSGQFPALPCTKPLGDAVIVCTDVRKEYEIKGRDDKVVALKHVALDFARDNTFYPIRRGEFVMLRGPSGGGKTTLLNLLGTIDRASAGTVELFGDEINAQSSDAYLSKLRLAKIGFVFQTFNLLATMSAFENVELPMTILGKLSKAQRTERAKKLLALVGLQDRMDHLPSELSGGEQQRVTIARALANEPDLLLLDEPTGDLDTSSRIIVMDLILKINKEQGVTVVQVSHNADLECYADRILYISDGRLVKQAVNVEQKPLIYKHYVQLLDSRNQ